MSCISLGRTCPCGNSAQFIDLQPMYALWWPWENWFCRLSKFFSVLEWKWCSLEAFFLRGSRTFFFMVMSWVKFDERGSPTYSHSIGILFLFRVSVLLGLVCECHWERIFNSSVSSQIMRSYLKLYKADYMFRTIVHLLIQSSHNSLDLIGKNYYIFRKFRHTNCLKSLGIVFQVTSANHWLLLGC